MKLSKRQQYMWLLNNESKFQNDSNICDGRMMNQNVKTTAIFAIVEWWMKMSKR